MLEVHKQPKAKAGQSSWDWNWPPTEGEGLKVKEARALDAMGAAAVRGKRRPRDDYLSGLLLAKQGWSPR